MASEAEENVKTLEMLSAVRTGDPYKLQTVLNGNWNWETRYGPPLLVAAYFGPPSIVRFLLENGANVNCQNKEGDTPLHKAALTGRADIVGILMKQPDIDFTLENKEGFTPLDVAKNNEVAALIEASVVAYNEDLTKQLLASAKSGDLERVQELLSGPNSKYTNLNVHDPLSGNTLLHYVAKEGSKDLVIRVLQQGGDPNIPNHDKLTPSEVATDDSIKKILKTTRFQEPQASLQPPIKLSGPLDKWTNYATGWKKRWFTVENGMIFYYNSAKEVSESSRGSIRLHGATILAKKSDSRMFMIRGKNSTTYHLRAETEAIRKKWLSVLVASSKIKSELPSRLSVRGHQDFDTGSSADLNLSKLNLDTSEPKNNDHVSNRGSRYSESLDVSMDALKWQKQSMEKLLKSIQEEFANDEKLEKFSSTFSMSSNATLEIMSSLLQATEERVNFWKTRYEQERAARVTLEESLKKVSGNRGHINFESPNEGHNQNNGNNSHHHKKTDHEDTDDVFFDAETESDYYVPETPVFQHQESVTELVLGSTSSKNFQRRTTLPTPMLDRSNVSLWAIVKEFVGKDLSKIAVPVYFNEPLSFLQKFSEDMEYCELMGKACHGKTSMERMLYVIAFAISPYSSTTRIAKPFNPILGETFEMVREDLKFKSIAEQVSHHPPISACYCEGEGYTYWAEAHIKNRFLGNTLEIIPNGIFHLMLQKYNEHYSWNRVKSSANNLIIGSVWVDNYGTMEVVNHKTGEKAIITFKPKGWWGKGYGEIEGSLMDSQGNTCYNLIGNWNENLKCVKVNNGHELMLWKKNLPLVNCEKYYNFTKFAIQLNEIEPGTEKFLPKTDSRLRPDQRALEDGDIQKATSEKLRVEQKQREARKRREENGETWEPHWFERAFDEDSKSEFWRYKGGYWEARGKQQFDDIEEIF